MSERSETYWKLVEASGLSEIFAEPTIERVCQRVGLDPITLSRHGLIRALPALEEALAVYHAPKELERAMVKIRALLPPGSGQFRLSLDADEPESEDERTLPERVAQAMAAIRNGKS